MISMLRRLALFGAAILLAACGTGWAPSTIEVDQDRLEEAIAKHFPFKTRWLGVVDVSASKPVLRLLPQSNRIGTDVELNVDERLSARRLRGALSFESALRFEPSDSSLRLSQVTVDRIALAGLPDLLSSQTGLLGTVLAEQALEDVVLYRLTDAQRELLRREGVQPGEIRVTPRGLAIDLVRRAAP